MKVAYFDCFAGISGDMTLGALLDLGVEQEQLLAELSKLKGIKFDLRVQKIAKKGIEAMDVHVLTGDEHHHRHLDDIREIILSSGLSEDVKEKAFMVFQRLAEAEATVHGTTPEKVHFHEVGAVDAIVDIVGACIGMDLLGLELVIASPMPMSRGFVEAAHGKIPLPAPATVELLKGVPVYPTDVEGELVTPTGAAIIRTLASDFGLMPPMIIESVGYGAGKSDFEFPNVLRVFVGETISDTRCDHVEKVSIIETNIDDMNPELFDSVSERLFQAGALDVFMTPVFMKKNRPATLLSVMCPTELADDIASIILTETTTFGLRVSESERRCLDREWKTVSTRFGDIRIKVGLMGGVPVKASPEYEDCRRAAETHAVPIRQVYEEAVVKYASEQEDIP